MKIKVTQEHIDKGCPQLGRKCPIAYAIFEATGKRVVVGGRSVWFESKCHIPLPGIAAYFVITYDRGCNVSPFEFDLDYELPLKLADMGFLEFTIDGPSGSEINIAKVL
jgi:hypothetical protein